KGPTRDYVGGWQSVHRFRPVSLLKTLLFARFPGRRSRETSTRTTPRTITAVLQTSCRPGCIKVVPGTLKTKPSCPRCLVGFRFLIHDDGRRPFTPIPREV